jgi:regulation of enolase protein 1 (concanavalin A-like superfamily)
MFDEPDDKLEEMLDHLDEADLRVVRIILDYRLEMDENGKPLKVGEYNPCILGPIDELMVMAKRKGILLMIAFHMDNFVDHPALINKDTYGWRKCQTPVNLYELSKKEGTQEVYDPYKYEDRGNGDFTSEAARAAYKQRVEYVLNHVNPAFGKPWKEINDVIWAWGLETELEEYADPAGVAWLNEMATHVKNIDPDTYIATGTLGVNFTDVITDADIYTVHSYDKFLTDHKVQKFQEEIGIPYGKLLLVEETGPADERAMGTARRNGVPWMLWEYGYNFDKDDVWHANEPGGDKLHGVAWGATVFPEAKRIWNTKWNWETVGKQWDVHRMVKDLCPQPDAVCDRGEAIQFLDTFAFELGPGYHWFDEGAEDEFRVKMTAPLALGVPEVDRAVLVIEAKEKQDLWGNSSKKAGAPLLLRPAPTGDFSFETYVETWKQDPNTQAGLFVFKDEGNWLFFGLTLHDYSVKGTKIQGDGLIATITRNGESSVLAEKVLAEDYAFLRIERWGPEWKLFWKLQHDDSWSPLTSVNLALSDYEVGMGVKTFDIEPSGSEYPGEALFDYFAVFYAQRLTVKQLLTPAGDPGRFNLQIDGVTHAANVGHGGSTGPQTVSAGVHTVSHTAGSGTDLDDYTTVIGGACAPDGTVTLGGGDNRTCVIISTAKSSESPCHEECAVQRDFCMEAGIHLPSQCVQEFLECIGECPP